MLNKDIHENPFYGGKLYRSDVDLVDLTNKQGKDKVIKWINEEIERGKYKLGPKFDKKKFELLFTELSSNALSDPREKPNAKFNEMTYMASWKMLSNSYRTNIKVSVNDAWSNENERFRRLLWSPLLTVKTITPTRLRWAIRSSLRAPGVFNPQRARNIWGYLLSEAGVKDSSKAFVLDMSAGWGDRLIGAASLPVARYWGIDPSPHKKIYQRIMSVVDFTGIKLTYHSQGSEDASSYPKGQNVDVAFTSPPYFNTEVYSKNPIGFTYDEYIRLFLEPTVRNTVQCLRPGGVIAINMAVNGSFNWSQWWNKTMRELGCIPKKDLVLVTASNFKTKSKEILFLAKKK